MDKGRLIAHAHVAVKKCKHGLMMYNVNDRFVGRSLDLYGEWCERELELLGQVTRPGYVVVDVGANIGTHTVFFGETTGRTGTVIAVEPQRLCFQMLCGNVALNGLVNVICLQAAAGSARGTIKVPVIDPATSYNFGALSVEGHTAGENVRVIAIDDLALARCNLVKIDVEGMECQVLQGARNTIARLRPVLFVENNTIERSAEIISLIHALHYDCWWHIADYFSEANYFANCDNVFAAYQPEANLLCFPEGSKARVSGLNPVAGAEDNWRAAVGRIRAAAAAAGGGATR